MSFGELARPRETILEAFHGTSRLRLQRWPTPPRRSGLKVDLNGGTARRCLSLPRIFGIRALNPFILFLLFWAGLAAGFMDSIAGGGGLITVPALLYAGLPPQMALGTNKLQSSCGTALAVYRYAASGLVQWRMVRFAVVASFLSSIGGALLVGSLPDTILRKCVPALLIFVAGYMVFSRDPRRSERVEASAMLVHPARLGPVAFGVSVGMLLGFYDGFFGPGVGAFWTVCCMTLLGLGTLYATAFTKAVNLASNLGSLVVFLGAGKVDWACAVVMLCGQLLGARAGSGMVLRRGARVIRPVLVVVAVLLALRLLL
jgi:uncharacterized membrane protein YfcA